MRIDLPLDFEFGEEHHYFKYKFIKRFGFSPERFVKTGSECFFEYFEEVKEEEVREFIINPSNWLEPEYRYKLEMFVCMEQVEKEILLEFPYLNTQIVPMGKIQRIYFKDPLSDEEKQRITEIMEGFISWSTNT